MRAHIHDGQEHSKRSTDRSDTLVRDQTSPAERVSPCNTPPVHTLRIRRLHRTTFAKSAINAFVTTGHDWLASISKGPLARAFSYLRAYLLSTPFPKYNQSSPSGASEPHGYQEHGGRRDAPDNEEQRAHARA